ncbi:MAG TPA: TonB-dependent receptor [Vicinamibacterales bacterium]|nr:TonB-dependent receptor [Vicinamibacterales bacterium]
MRQAGGTVLLALVGAGTFVAAQQRPAAPPCTLTGTVTSGTTPLPGVSIVLSQSGAVAAASSTDENGMYRVRVSPGEYGVSAQMAAFAPHQGSVTIDAGSGACGATLDIRLTLASRSAATAPAGPIIEAPGLTRRPPRLGGRGQAGAQGDAEQRFAALQVLQAESAGAAPGSGDIEEGDPATRLLPPGFSTNAATDVVAVSGSAVNLDRGQLRDRLDALGRGDFGLPGGEAPVGVAGGAGFAPGGPGGGGAGPGGPGGGFAFGGGQGGFGGPGGRGGGGFLGRGRGNRVQGSTTYTFGGSALDAAPYALRGPQTTPDYMRQQFGGSVGGPLRIPGVYDGARTTYFVNYNGGRSDSFVDQYATVPTAAMRAGDFSGLSTPIDPATGQPFANAVIPAERIDPAARALLAYIPLPNLPGASQNFRRTATSATTTDGISLRITHNFTATPQRGQGGQGARSGFGGGGGRGGRGGFGRGNAVVLNAQVQYQRSDSDAVNVFPLLGGANETASFSAPIQLNVLRGRTIHNVRVTATHSHSTSRTQFSGLLNAAGAAGITGISQDPFDWGLPSLSFAGLSGLRDLTPTRRADTRLGADYTFTHPWQRHTLRLGGGARRDISDGRTVSDARGAFVFTGLYTGAGGVVARGSGLDFADFLLGMPQQASVGFGPGDVTLRGLGFNLFAQDDWRARSNLTFNLGVRYEVQRPYTEASGHMANLDVAPGFTAAAAVVSGAAGLYTGGFPDALVNADVNNVAPRVGLAWRVNPRTIVRTGYSISFNNGSYASIARQLVAQPPFATANTILGTAAGPLDIESALTATTSATTNNYGVDKDYQLGALQTWNVDLNRTLGRGWQVGGGYTGTKGSHLDIVRAPNRGPDGLRIPGVQPFLWQSSEGESTLHAMTVRVRKNQTRGLAGTASYTLAKSIDNASSIGGGGQVVAQNDQDLEAERGLSSFDRRHQFDSNLSFELPFGANRQWLHDGGPWAALLSGWSLSTSFTAQSGTPFTARVLAAASDVARGTNGTLRADYVGAPVALDSPTLLRFFNTSAFVVPAPGTFGNAGRNTIIGPGETQLNASLGRDVRLTGTQVLSLRVEATNLFNSVRFGAIDTAVNSPTFGQVILIRPMRTLQFNARYRF